MRKMKGFVFHSKQNIELWESVAKRFVQKVVSPQF